MQHTHHFARLRVRVVHVIVQTNELLSSQANSIKLLFNLCVVGRNHQECHLVCSNLFGSTRISKRTVHLGVWRFLLVLLPLCEFLLQLLDDIRCSANALHCDFLWRERIPVSFPVLLLKSLLQCLDLCSCDVFV